MATEISSIGRQVLGGLVIAAILGIAGGVGGAWFTLHDLGAVVVRLNKNYTTSQAEHAAYLLREGKREPEIRSIKARITEIREEQKALLERIRRNELRLERMIAQQAMGGYSKRRD